MRESVQKKLNQHEVCRDRKMEKEQKGGKQRGQKTKKSFEREKMEEEEPERRGGENRTTLIISA